MTYEEKRKINTALTTNNGSRALAAAALNITAKSLKAIIHNNADLKKLWAKPKGQTLLRAQQSNHKSVEMEVIAESEEQIMERREREFQKLLAGTETVEELEQSFALQRVYSKFTEEAESMIGGGLVSQSIKLTKLCEKLSEKMSELLTDGKLGPEFVAVSNALESSEKTIARIMEVVSANRVAKAKIKSMNEAAKGNKRRGTPGFAPKKTNIIATNVQVNNK